MLSRNQIFLSAVFILVAGFFFLSTPETSYAQPSDCCFGHGTPGCDNGTCEVTICAQDPFCCDTAWDNICAAQANDICAVCTGAIAPVPTMSEWGTIAFAGILGLIGFFYIFIRRKRATS